LHNPVVAVFYGPLKAYNTLTDAPMTPDLFTHVPLRKGRTHECSGPGALGFACALGARMEGPVMWIKEARERREINPVGLGAYLDPQRVLLARAKDAAESLAVAEETLRSATVPFVVIELMAPISLTAGRRLQLAAEAGQSTGLCLIPDGMVSNATETRWRCDPIFSATDSTLQCWQLTKNKSGTLGVWNVRWDAETRRVIVVSETGKRPGS
jgi:protein ImuA